MFDLSWFLWSSCEVIRQDMFDIILSFLPLPHVGAYALNLSENPRVGFSLLPLEKSLINLSSYETAVWEGYRLYRLSFMHSHFSTSPSFQKP